MLNCNVKNYGAVGDGVTLDTAAIQAAIDNCSAHGGGQVILEDGRFLCGRIDMKDGVDLHIERDAVLLGSTNGYDFPEIETKFWRTEYAPRFNARCMIYAEGCVDIAITGRGKIDCQGEYYMDPLPEEQAKRGMWPFTRNTTISPARVVFFIGCKNVLVEDVTMQNQPAGWSYWICDCENVHFHRAQILASVKYPNNDGIHINCSRNVTVSDCNITCGDDAIVVRAYSMPMYEHVVCEKVAVTNCNLTSHSGAIRIGWYNDGVIRNCTFSNLNITDSTVGVDIRLPNTPEEGRGSDQGDEPTLVENLSFSNITIDRTYHEPIYIYVGERNLCTAIRNIYFSNMHGFTVHMPTIIGRENCHVQNIYFDNCHFTQIKRESIPNHEDGSYGEREHTLVPCFKHVDNLVMNNTVFNVL